jgi:hypothetical protein
MVPTRFAVVFLAIVSVLYLGSILGLLFSPYVALFGSTAMAAVAVASCRPLRALTVGLHHLLAPAVGLLLVVRFGPNVVKSITWDVVSYGLLKYPEAHRRIVGPFFSYGSVYEFLVSYTNQLLPPAGGLSFLHSLSIFFLAVFALNYAYTTRSWLAAGACILLLFADPMGIVAPALSYSLVGKNDVLLAALILQTWAVVLDRRYTRARPIGALAFVVANAVAACAVGIKPSAAIAIGLPLLLYWGEFLAQAVRGGRCWRWPVALSAAAVAWLLFCWQYLANVIVLGSVFDPHLTRLGAATSALGKALALGSVSPTALAPLSLPVLGLVLSLMVLIVVGLLQRAGREVLFLRISALLLVVLCPWLFPRDAKLPELRLVLPAVLLAGIDAAAIAGGLLAKLTGSIGLWAPSRERPLMPSLPAVAWAVPVVLAVLSLSPRTLPTYEAYFYPDYRAAYLHFTDMPGTTIYAYGLRPYFLLGRKAQHRVIYDLNPPVELLKDPARFARHIAECVSPDFLVFSEHLIGGDYFPKLLIDRLEVVTASEHFVILRNRAESRDPRRSGTCPPRYRMLG